MLFIMTKHNMQEEKKKKGGGGGLPPKFASCILS